MNSDFRYNPFASTGRYLSRGYGNMRQYLDQGDNGDTNVMDSFGRAIVSTIAAPFLGNDSPGYRPYTTIKGRVLPNKDLSKEVPINESHHMTMINDEVDEQFNELQHPLIVAAEGEQSGTLGTIVREEGGFIRHVTAERPSAVTRTDGRKFYNENFAKFEMGGQGRGKKFGGRGRFPKKKKPFKKGLKKIARTIQSENARINATVRRMRTPARRPRRMLPSKTRLYGMPSNVSSGFRGFAQRMQTKRANCIRIKTRLFLGTMQADATSGVDFTIDGTNNTHGQFYFNPTNAAYVGSNTANNTFINMARQFSRFYINDFNVEFQSQIMPGVTSANKINWAWVQDIQAGFAQIASFSSSTNLTKTQILSMPDSGSFPAWIPMKILSPPPKYYKGRKLWCRSRDFDQLLLASSIDTNRLAYPFGLWMSLDYSPTGSAFNIADVFINIDIDFCEMVPTMIKDATGGATFSSPAPVLGDTKGISAPVKLSSQELDADLPIGVDLAEVKLPRPGSEVKYPIPATPLNHKDLYDFKQWFDKMQIGKVMEEQEKLQQIRSVKTDELEEERKMLQVMEGLQKDPTNEELLELRDDLIYVDIDNAREKRIARLDKIFKKDKVEQKSSSNKSTKSVQRE